ncbi:hypothetical protein V5O48_015687 [Marasmius crinis-equi]|uniref:Uncharacterized protein n=1 Tax=Marasmius crinis-equi TaxID=585013 RepID=A0ABR3ETU4_9AGAR
MVRDSGVTKAAIPRNLQMEERDFGMAEGSRKDAQLGNESEIEFRGEMAQSEVTDWNLPELGRFDERDGFKHIRQPEEDVRHPSLKTLSKRQLLCIPLCTPNSSQYAPPKTPIPGFNLPSGCPLQYEVEYFGSKDERKSGNEAESTSLVSYMF